VIADPLWPPADRWLGSSSEEPDLVVAGVPSSSSSLSPSEAWRTPPSLRAALARFSVYDSEDGVDLSSLGVVDLGDWPVDGIGRHEMLDQVTLLASELAAGPVHAFIGGDNAITRPLVRGLARGDLSDVGVLTLDAHHDVRSTDDGPTNGNPIRGLIDDGLPDGRVVQVGIHSFANSSEYRDFCTDHSVEVVSMAAVDEVGAGWMVTSALDDLAKRCRTVFVDVDLDVLDLAYAPGCPGARPGGMTPRQLGAACRAAGAHPVVGAVDFVEVDAARDVTGITVLNLAHAFLSFCSGLAQRRRS
jgi:formiminoglutamase